MAAQWREMYLLERDIDKKASERVCGNIVRKLEMMKR
jgi:hypothetical protein